jgi:hypothetical protein
MELIYTQFLMPYGQENGIDLKTIPYYLRARKWNDLNTISDDLGARKWN